MSAGKGDRPRNVGKKFRENYDEINWHGIMNKKPIEQRLREIIIEQLCLDSSEFRLDAQYEADFNADSLDVIELIMAVETEFDISIDDKEEKEFLKCKTVKESLDLLEKKLDQQA